METVYLLFRKQLKENKDRYENIRKQLDEADSKLLNAERTPSNTPDNKMSNPANEQINIEPPTVLTTASSASDL